MTYIPSKETKKHTVANNGDLFGNIIRPRNLDFNKRGYITLARKPRAMLTETVEANFETPLAILMDDDNAYVITSESMYEIDITSANYSTTERVAGTPPSLAFQSDGCFFGGVLHASGTTTVNSFASNTWTSRITGLSSSYPHPLCQSEHQQYLAVGNGNTVALYNSAYSLVTTCTVPVGHVVTWIRWRANLLFFGTRNINGGNARMFIWNGSGTAAQSAYGAGADWIFSGCEYGSSIAVVTSIGALLQFAGDGFVPIRTRDGNEMHFPVYYTGIPWGSSASVSNLNGKVSSRGMEAKGDKIYLCIQDEIEFSNGGTQRTTLEMPGGLWVADPAVGLYHKAGIDHKQRKKVVISAIASNVATLPSATVFETGDPVRVASYSGITGDIDDLIYYAIKVDSTHLKLAFTPQQALAGDNIILTGTPNSLDIWTFDVYESVGSTRMNRGGVVAVASSLGMPRSEGIELLFAGEVETSTGTTIGSVCSLGMGKNVGSFVTPKMQASAVTDEFKKLVAKFPPMYLASRKLILKYRTANRWGSPGRGPIGTAGATWVTSTTFTINPKTYDFYSAEVGDEVLFTGGAAAGYSAHITDITVDSATQWTITIDEAMPDVVASDKSQFVHENWTKYKTISTEDDLQAATRGFKNNAFGKNAKWVQLKIELRGYTDIEETVDLEEVMLTNAPDQKYV